MKGLLLATLIVFSGQSLEAKNDILEFDKVKCGIYKFRGKIELIKKRKQNDDGDYRLIIFPSNGQNRKERNLRLHPDTATSLVDLDLHTNLYVEVVARTDEHTVRENTVTFLRVAQPIIYADMYDKKKAIQLVKNEQCSR